MTEDRYTTTGQVSSRARHALDDLHDKPLNFDLEGQVVSAEDGWRIDDWCQELPPEPPGDPLPHGSYQSCRDLMEAYEFADPAIVRAVYHGDRPLEDRDMVLEAHFYGLKFLLALRVGGVRDERVEVDGRPVQRWGWNYQTLTGHLEMGQMDYDVYKWLDTGKVEFRIHAFSRGARIHNPIVRLGFAVFGRTMQKRFARNALRRMRRLVELRLIAQATGVGIPTEHSVADEVEVRSAGEAGVTLPSGR
jgi:uncharacterized protein (UPF0548 family)